jgi:serine/threonine-protein kinase
MLTGKRAFEGEDVSEVFAFIITKEPDGGALPPDVPPAIRKLLHRCLQKDRRKRLADIADAKLEIEEVISAPAAAGAPVAPLLIATRLSRLWILITALVLTTAAVTAAVMWDLAGNEPLVSRRAQRFTVAFPGSVSYPDSDAGFAVSPDGELLVSPVIENGRRLLYTRRMDRIDMTPIRGTEGAYAPFFSPDGQWIAFFTDPGAGRGTLRKVPLHGGAPIEIAPAPSPAGGVWAKDDTIIFASGTRVAGGLKRVSANSGKPVELTKLRANEVRHGWPDVLPDGDTILFSVISGKTPSDAAGYLAAVSLKTGEIRTIVESGRYGRYAASGHLVYAVESVLLAVPFDLRQLRTAGPPVPFIHDLRFERGGLLPSPTFAISPTGFLIHANPVAEAQRTLVWIDRFGREKALGTPPRRYASARLSPDGTRVALDVREQRNDIWVWNIDRKTLTPVTSGPDIDRFPIWSFDGKHILFGSPRNNTTDNIYSHAADGTGDTVRMTENAEAQHYPQSFAPDGSLIYTERSLQGRVTNLQMRTATGDTRLLLRTQVRIGSAEVSPDGRLLAYASDDTGTMEVYVRPFPNVESERVLISTGGGFRPVWGPNGRELFYLVGTSPDPVAVMAATVEPSSPIRASAARKLIEGTLFYASSANILRTYDISADGQRFLMIKDANQPNDADQASALTVVVNLFDELTHVAPPRE